MNESFPVQKSQEREGFSQEDIKFLEQKVEDMKDGALLEEDFEGRQYDSNFISQCKERVSGLKDAFEKSNKISELKSETQENFKLSKEYRKISEYLEALFYEKLGGKDGWIPDAIVWKTSEYDDYVNGIDFVVETKDKNLALATDITFSQNKSLEGKLNKIKANIDSGTLPNLTFYDSNDPDKRPMPRVVIAVEREKVVKVLKLWSDTENNETFEKLLNRHPLRAKTMLELEMQLESFAVYAKNVGHREIASAYNDLLAQVQLLIVDYEDTIKQYRNLIDDDSAYQTIVAYCEKLKNLKTSDSTELAA